MSGEGITITEALLKLTKSIINLAEMLSQNREAAALLFAVLSVSFFALLKTFFDQKLKGYQIDAANVIIQAYKEKNSDSNQTSSQDNENTTKIDISDENPKNIMPPVIGALVAGTATTFGFTSLFSDEKQKHTGTISGEDGNRERNLAEDLVRNYHNQALSQAKIQFLFSIIVACIGFYYILATAHQSSDNDFSTAIKILPGVVVDMVAALFFRQAEQTRQRATDLYDRLRKDRQMERAEILVGSIEDESIRSAVKAQIALHMAGLLPKEIDIKSFISINASEDGWKPPQYSKPLHHSED